LRPVTSAPVLMGYFILFCTACRTNVMWTFLFATCFAYATWHNRQCVMRTALCGTCFTCFTFWRCHFLSSLFSIAVLFYSFSGHLQEKVYHCPDFRPDSAISTRCLTSVVCRHLHVRCVLHVLRHGQFHVHDVHRHPFQSVSDGQQSGFHLYQPIYRSHH